MAPPVAGQQQDPTTTVQAGCVFSLVQRIRSEIERSVDTVLSFSELASPSCDYALVKPLTTLLARSHHRALPFALLLVRVHFLERADDDLAFQGVNTTRAALCELLATKLLSLFDPLNELPLVLTTRFNAFEGVQRSYFEAGSVPSQDEIDDMLEHGQEEQTSALDLAVETKAKHFVRSPSVQRFVHDLYVGRLLHKPSSQFSIMKDTYKSDVIEFFDIQNRPILDHNVLRVPRLRRIIEFLTIFALVALFMLVQRTRDLNRLEGTELLFILFTWGFALEEAASIRERGVQTYFQHLWNIFDFGYLAIFFTYFGMRIAGLARQDPDLSVLAFDVVALGACLLFPRLCGMLLRDSIVLLGLRAMLADYVRFMLLAVLCSVGFLLAFYVLGEGKIGIGSISWVMVKVFLGNSYVGFDLAPIFGPNLGPGLMLVFAVFSNTLLLTILISILTNTFSAIQYNLVEESLFQKAVTTLDMVKGDALFEFGTPANLVALPLLLPASFLLSARRFHQFNVLLIRITNFPLLILVHVYYRIRRRATSQRIALSGENGHSRLLHSLPRSFRRSYSERVFERRVVRSAKRVPGMDENGGGGGAKGSGNSNTRQSAGPVAISGSGGQGALGIRQTMTPSHSAEPVSLLAQLFGGIGGGKQSETSTAPSAAAAAAVSQAQSVNGQREESLKAVEDRLAKIEGMLDRLLTGGYKAEGDDRSAVSA